MAALTSNGRRSGNVRSSALAEISARGDHSTASARRSVAAEAHDQLTDGTRRESDSVRTLDGYHDAFWPA
jgi:hypothetical protein